MLDHPMAAFSDDALDPLLGLTCAVPFVWKSVADGICPVCTARLYWSTETVRRLSVPCSAAGCGFVRRARGRLTMKDH